MTEAPRDAWRRLAYSIGLVFVFLVIAAAAIGAHLALDRWLYGLWSNEPKRNAAK